VEKAKMSREKKRKGDEGCKKESRYRLIAIG
jgi:hypothetical protein